jgi:hypothetical protein
MNHDLIEQHIDDPRKKQFRMYFFEIDGIPSVLFDRFFQRDFRGITDDDRMITIPKLIHDKFENLSHDLAR